MQNKMNFEKKAPFEAISENIDSAMLVKDHKQRLVLLIANEWQTNWICERNPDITFCTTPDELALDDDEE